MKPSKKPSKPYWEMNTAELREATKEFDRESVADTFRPLTPAERARWNRLKRKKSSGPRVVSVSIERELLRSVDRLAKRRKVSRASLIAQGLRAVLAAQKPAARPKQRSATTTTKPKPRSRRAA